MLIINYKIATRRRKDLCNFTVRAVDFTLPKLPLPRSWRRSKLSNEKDGERSEIDFSENCELPEDSKTPSSSLRRGDWLLVLRDVSSTTTFSPLQGSDDCFWSQPERRMRVTDGRLKTFHDNKSKQRQRCPDHRNNSMVSNTNTRFLPKWASRSIQRLF